MAKKMTTAEFIAKAKSVHGDKYDYTKTVYVNANTKVCITCPIHGDFMMLPYNHIGLKGCPSCGREKLGNSKRYTTEEFISKAREVHGDKYDYSKVVYESATKKVCIICPIHGEFWQTPNSHLSGKGCLKCATTQTIFTTEQFIAKAREVHGDKYDYSKVKYVSGNREVCIICPEHGEFWQRPYNHLKGKGCQKCVGRGLTKDDVILKFRKVHGDKYDYSKVDFGDKGELPPPEGGGFLLHRCDSLGA